MNVATSLTFFLLAADPAPPIVALAIAPDGTQVITASQAGAIVRSLPDLAAKQLIQTKLVQVNDLAFSPDGKLLAIAGGSPAESGKVEIWSWPELTHQATIAAGGDLAYRVAWNTDVSRLAIASGDRKLRIAAAGGGEVKAYECHSAAVLATAWLPVDDLVLSAGADQSIRVLKAATGEVADSLDTPTAAVRDLAVRPGQYDGPVMVASCGADRTVRFWQPTIGRLVRFASKLQLPSPPTAIAWTPDGSRVLAAFEDGKLRSVDPDTTEVRELAPRLAGVAYAVACLPDGSAALLAGAGGELRIMPLDGIRQ
jgi:WD40 repeat protein